MKRPQIIALAFFATFLLAALLVTMQVNRRTEFFGDMYSQETGAEPLASDFMEDEDWDECEDCCEEDEEVCEGAPELALPTGEVYVDRYAPSLRAGSGVVFGTPVVCGNKSLVPLYPQSLDVCSETTFLTLAEAVEGGQAKVVDSDAVEAVYVVNESEMPIFLMCGEILFGGKQDRVIAQDTVIPAEKGKKFEVGVFCVEQGRWRESDTGVAFTCKPEAYKEESGNSDEGSEPGNAAHSLAQAKEQKPQENASENLSGRGIVCACILSDCGEGGQSEVWSRVSETNKRLGTDNPTGTYRDNLSSADVNKRMKAELETFVRASAHDKKAIGYAFMLDGNVIYVDIFANPDLCRKYRYGLIKAYLLDALGKSCNPRSTTTAASLPSFLSWVERHRLSEKARPGFALYKAEFLLGCDCTYKGKRLHSGYYHDGLVGE